jgi:hypothetical protein
LAWRHALFAQVTWSAQDKKYLTCDESVMWASCQGAPCFDIAYDAPVFDLT